MRDPSRPRPDPLARAEAEREGDRPRARDAANAPGGSGSGNGAGSETGPEEGDTDEETDDGTDPDDERPRARCAFGEDFRSTVGALRDALRSPLAHAELDPERGQELARTFALDKSLAWKLSRLLTAEGEVEALRFVPGQSGLQILVERLGAQVPAAEREALRRAVDDFERLCERHAGDRASLDLLALGLAEQRPIAELVEPARRQAFLGNSSIWGFQVRTQVALFGLVVDDGAPDRVRLIELGGLLGFRRLRPDVRVELLSYERENELAPRPLSDQAHAPLLSPFCSRPDLRVERVRSGPFERLRLGPGPVGNTARLDLAWGLAAERHAARWRSSGRPEFDVGVRLGAPAESLELAVAIDRQLEWGVDPGPRLIGRLAHGDGSRPGDAELPIERGPRLDPDPRASLARRHGPRLGALFDHLVELLGGDRERFDVWRLPLAYPPIPSELRLRFVLPAR